MTSLVLAWSRHTANGGFLAKAAVLAVLVFFFVAPYLRWPMEDVFWRAQAAVLAGGLVLFSVHLTTLVLGRLRLDRDLALTLLPLCVPLLLALTANRFFGQPLLYGLLGSREWAVYCWVPLLIVALERRWIEESHLRFTLLTFAWASLLFYVAFVAVASPTDPRFERLVSSSVTRGYRFALVPTLLVFAALYYFVDFVRRRSLQAAASFLAFFGYLLAVHQSRSLLAVLALVMAWIVLRHARLRDKALYLALGIVLLPAVVGALLLVSPDTVRNFALGFEQVGRALLGIETADTSANARIFESATALGYLLQHPLAFITGSGRLSNQWLGGYERLFGHFYPSDIGVLGAVFSFGIAGIALASVLAVRAFLLARRNRLYSENTFFLACFYFLGLKLIRSLSAGDIVFLPGELVIPIAVLLCANRLQAGIRARASAVRPGRG